MDYKSSIKELIEFVKEAQQNENKIIVIEKLSSELADYLIEESDFDLHGFNFSIDAYAVKHILKNHRDKAKENNRGQEVITEEDLLLLPEILNEPDIVFYDGKNKLGKDCFQFQKTIGNRYIIIKEVRTGKKQLALNTMRVFLTKKEN